MARTRKGRAVSGILLLNKSSGISSNRALQQTKHLFNAQKAGHTGSLDPMATGVLPICFGEATKFSQYLLNANKSYRAKLRLGVTTDTGDAEGQIISQSLPPLLSLEKIKQVLSSFLGASEQVPPMYSALKHQGQPLYKLARQGKTIERKKRPITITEISLVALYNQGDDELTIEVSCSKGTYIRVLAEDIAKRLGSEAHLIELERVAVGGFDIKDAFDFQDLQAKVIQNKIKLDSVLIPTEKAVNHLLKVELSEIEEYHIRHGRKIAVSGLSPVVARLHGTQDEFLGVGEIDLDGQLSPKRLLSTAVITKN